MTSKTKSSSRTILVTGATGYLGSEIVARLIERDRRPILCLVRGASADQATSRVRDAVSAALGRQLEPGERERLRCVRGDIETAYFGLAPTVHDSLAGHVEEVFHCAACTRLDRPLRDARWTNVRGLQTVYAFAAQAAAFGEFRRFHHISTAYVVGNAGGEVRAGRLPDDDRATSYRNTYEQTKAEAERWLQSRSMIPTTVYRPAVIVGDSRTGRTTSWTAVHYAMNLMASKWLRFAPGTSAGRLDCVPGDFVAEAILALGASADSAGAIFHITSGEKSLFVHELVDHTRRGIERHVNRDAARMPKVSSPFRRRLLALANRCFSSGRQRRALRKYAKCEPYTRLSCIFENGREQRLLAKSGVCLPEPSVFFPRTVDYAFRSDFGKEPEAMGRSPIYRRVRANMVLAHGFVAGSQAVSPDRFQ